MGWAAWTAGLQDQRDGDHWLRGRFQSALIQSGTLVSQRSDEMRNVHSPISVRSRRLRLAERGHAVFLLSGVHSS